MKCIEYMESLSYTYVNRKTGNPKTGRKMINFKIFCELLAKMMPGTIDFTIVFREYRRNEKPEKLGIVAFYYFYDYILTDVEMKSPRNWTL